MDYSNYIMIQQISPFTRSQKKTPWQKKIPLGTETWPNCKHVITWANAYVDLHSDENAKNKTNNCAHTDTSPHMTIITNPNLNLILILVKKKQYIYKYKNDIYLLVTYLTMLLNIEHTSHQRSQTRWIVRHRNLVHGSKYAYLEQFWIPWYYWCTVYYGVMHSIPYEF